MKITIAIVTYNNSFEDLNRVIQSVLNTDLIIRLFIVDNSPSQAIKKICSDERIEYIHNPTNPGFGKAHNLAIKFAEQYNSQYHLILNPDIYFSEGVLEELKDFMDKNTDIGLTMPKILYPDGTLQYLCKLLPRPIDVVVRRFIKNKNILDRFNYNFELRGSGHNKIMDVPYLSGCFMFCRMNILNQVGGFDDRFFMYFEDTDLTRRIHAISRTVYYPEVEVFHHHEKGSFRNLKLFKYHVESAFKYFRKWGWFFDFERKRINKETLSQFEPHEN